MKKSSLIALAFLFVGCASYTPQETEGIKVVSDQAAVANCYLLGPVIPNAMVFNTGDVMKADAKQRGADTLLRAGAFATPEAYVCDPAKVAEHRDFDAKVAAVRITNRQDVVTVCRFIKNVTASTEDGARAEAVKAGGNLFYIVSDTTRTETTKASGSTTAYTYEVRRLTGEVYACPQP